MDWYPWVVLIHITGAFAFAAAHGVSVFVAFAIRGERDPSRIAALLDLSAASIGGLYIGLLVLLGGGVAAAFMAGLWGELWIWGAIAILTLILGAMYPLGSLHYAQVRHAVGLPAYSDKKDAPPPTPLPPDELALLLSSPRPFVLAGIGGVGFLLILWLMVAKPF
jgi:hypothetical protein